MKLDYLKMLQDIDDLVSTDFCQDMSMGKTIGKYDARKLAGIVGQVYLIAHATHCASCGKKYEIRSK